MKLLSLLLEDPNNNVIAEISVVYWHNDYALTPNMKTLCTNPRNCEIQKGSMETRLDLGWAAEASNLRVRSIDPIPE